MVSGSARLDSDSGEVTVVTMDFGPCDTYRMLARRGQWSAEQWRRRRIPVPCADWGGRTPARRRWRMPGACVGLLSQSATVADGRRSAEGGEGCVQARDTGPLAPTAADGHLPAAGGEGLRSHAPTVAEGHLPAAGGEGLQPLAPTVADGHRPAARGEGLWPEAPQW